MKKPTIFLLATSITLGGALGLANADDKKKEAKKDKPVAEETAAKKSDGDSKAGPARGERPGGPRGNRPGDADGPPRGQRPGAPGQGDRRPGGPGGFQPPSFADMDADNDGAVSETEFVTAQVKQAEERARRGFGFVDADSSGSVTEEELRTAGERMRERFRGGQGGRPPGAPGADRRGQGPRPDGEGGARPPRPDRPSRPDAE